MQESGKKKIYMYLLIAFLVSLIPRLVLCFYTYPVRVISDEVATMAGGAYFAGLDWSAVISKAGYYGGGFYSLFFWIFKLTDNPFIIYKSILMIQSLVQAVSAILAFVIMYRYFKIKDGRVLCIFSIASSYMVVTRGTIAYNEHILIFITWMTVLLLLELQRSIGNKAKVRILTAGLAAVLGYSLTIHTRALTLGMSCGFVIIFYLFLYRKWLVSKLILIMGGILGYFLSNQFIDMIQKSLWSTDTGAIRNAELNISANFELLDPTTWFSGIMIILGQLNTTSVLTGGFTILCFVIFTWLLFGMLRDKICHKAGVQAENKELFLIISILSLAGIGMTMIAQSINWLPGVIEGVNEGFGTKLYSMKAVTYLRYFGPYLGPVILGGLVFGYKNREGIKSYLKPTMFIFAILQLCWVIFILPFVKNNYYVTEVFVASALWKPREPTVLGTFLPGIFISVAVFMLLVFLYKKEKVLIPAIVLTVILVFQYGYCSYSNDQFYAEKHMKYANAGFALIKRMQRSVELPEELYVFDASKATDHQIYYMYQFMLNRYKIIPELPVHLSEDTIIFSNSNKVTKLLELGYECIPLDKNEFAYAEGKMAAKIKSYWVK